jgi:uncharacterized surface protein with fasciclin (FAS1) repeats
MLRFVIILRRAQSFVAPCRCFFRFVIVLVYERSTQAAMRTESTTRWWRWALLVGIFLLLVVTNDTKNGVLGSGLSPSSSQNEGGGWAYLPGHDEADHDARDAAVLALFHDRRRRHLVAATTAAELFRSVIDESARASFGPGDNVSSAGAAPSSSNDDGTRQQDGSDQVQSFMDSVLLFSSGGSNGASRIDNGTGGTGKGGRWKTTKHKGGKAGSGKAERGQGSPTDDDNDNDDSNDAANDSTPSPSASVPPSSTGIAAHPVRPSLPVARPAVGKGKGHGNNKSKSQGDDDDDNDDSAADSTSMPLATAPPSAAVAADPMRPPSVPVARPTGGKGDGNNKSKIQDDDNVRPVGKGKGTSYKSKFQDDDDDVDDDDNTSDDDDDALDLKQPTLSPSNAKRPHTVSKSKKSVKPSDDDAAGDADSACHDFEFATDDRRFRHGRHYRQRALQFDGAGCSLNVLRRAAQMDDFSSFVALVVAAGMVDVFDCGGPFTLLVPTNAALSGLDQNDWTDDELREFVLGHVLPGVTRRDDFGTGTVEALSGGNVDVSVTGSNAILFNDGVNLTTADIMACNGVLHGIDAVLMDLVVADDPIPTMAPESPTMAPTMVSPTMAPVENPTMAPVKAPTIAPVTPCVGLADKIRQDPSMSIAVQVIERSGLEEELTSRGEKFTVLIPTDEAIRALGPETLKRLQDPSNFNTTLSLVLYHIIPGIVEAGDFQTGLLPTLLDGEAIVVSLSPLLLDNTRITSTDNAFCGGIYHVLDAVLIPSTDNREYYAPNMESRNDDSSNDVP